MTCKCCIFCSINLKEKKNCHMIFIAETPPNPLLISLLLCDFYEQILYIVYWVFQLGISNYELYIQTRSIKCLSLFYL